MTEKRYFSVDYDEEYYIFDSTKISKEEVLEKAEYSYDVFGESLMEDDVVNLLNENEQLKQEIRVIEKAKDSFYDKVEGLLTEHIEYNQLKPENMDSIIKELNELKMEIFE